MMGILITLHLIVCILLMVIVLIQAGRGGGLVEGFSSVESMFGTKTSAFLTRTTAILSVLFFVTCLSLAVLSAHRGKSLMRQIAPQKTEQAPVQATPGAEQNNKPASESEPKAQ
ncbi:MAG: preprotein translocase subunit SecG [Candidatus Omnitrophica bacterium]|nr:preprotein translocase subunit SecG [Candidatus Omnitrophota bacterium]